MSCGFLYDKRFLEHQTPIGHLESPARLATIIETLGPRPWLAARPATDEELLRGHTPAHLARVEALRAGWIDTGTYAADSTREIARLVVGGCLTLAERILEGDYRRGLALVRPPGHHAESELLEGYCFYSNLGLTAMHLHALGVNRVLALDWDVHHGNGTQSLLGTHPWARFIDLHQHPLYPGTGTMEERGQGSVFNLPLPAGLGSADYLHLFEQLVEPLVRDFDPEFVLVSAGFDPHRLDPLGGMELDGPGFGAMTDHLVHLAEDTAARGKIMLVLEGGYHLQALREGLQSVVRRLEDPARHRLFSDTRWQEPSQQARRLAFQTRQVFSL